MSDERGLQIIKKFETELPKTIGKFVLEEISPYQYGMYSVVRAYYSYQGDNEIFKGSHLGLAYVLENKVYFMISDNGPMKISSSNFDLIFKLLKEVMVSSDTLVRFVKGERPGVV